MSCFVVLNYSKRSAALNIATKSLKSGQELSDTSAAFTYSSLSRVCVCVWMVNLGMFWKFTREPVKHRYFSLSLSVQLQKGKRSFGDGRFFQSGRGGCGR